MDDQTHNIDLSKSSIQSIVSTNQIMSARDRENVAALLVRCCRRLVAAPPVNHPCARRNFGEGGGKTSPWPHAITSLPKQRRSLEPIPAAATPKPTLPPLSAASCLPRRGTGATPAVAVASNQSPCCCTSLAGRDRRRPSSLVLCLHVEAACERFHVEGYVAEKQRRGKKVKLPPGMEVPGVATATVTTPCYCRDSWPELLLSKLGVAAAGNLRCCSVVIDQERREAERGTNQSCCAARLVAAPPVNHPCARRNFGEGGGKTSPWPHAITSLPKQRRSLEPIPAAATPKPTLPPLSAASCLPRRGTGATPAVAVASNQSPCCCTSLAGRDRRRPSSLVLCLHVEAACERFHVEGYVAEKQRRGKKVKLPPGMEVPGVATATVTTPCYCRDSWPELLLSKLGVAAAGNLRCCSVVIDQERREAERGTNQSCCAARSAKLQSHIKNVKQQPDFFTHKSLRSFLISSSFILATDLTHSSFFISLTFMYTFVPTSLQQLHPGRLLQVRLVTNKINKKPRGYAFIEYVHTRDMKVAYKQADGKKIDNRRVLVDVQRG
nr:U1 small nuclear ribonucleoprotein 70 kDa-like [Ipomoea trifida]